MFILSLSRFCLCVECPVLITIHGNQCKELVQDYLSKGVRTAAILATILVASTATSALTPDLYINQLNAPNISTCTPTLAVAASAPTTFWGTNTYNWTLIRNGSYQQTKSEKITCNYGTQCQLPSFYVTVPAVSGNYQIKLAVFGQNDGYSNQINVTASSGGPTPMARINGSAATNVSVPDDGPIKLDGSLSSCASQYFLSIELSDKYWNRLGGEFAQWLTPAEYQRYGPISSFNVRAWAEDQWFHFVAGQYYRVKLAVGPGWHERTQLILITPYTPGPGEVRIRHKLSGKCIYVDTNSAQSVRNWTCWGDANMAFLIDPVGPPGEVRLRHKKTQQCLYGVPIDGGTAKSWGPCWNDPNMVFVIDPVGGTSGDVRLRHKSTQKCLYGDMSNGGAVRNFTCWNDPNMVLHIDPF
jgi:hypothetical protein